MTTVLTGLAVASFGQYLPVDSMGRCRVGEVVIAEGFSGALLFANQWKWLNGLAKGESRLSNIVKDSLNNKISADFEFVVYAQSGILKKVAGLISYHIATEAKDGKYRFEMKDFLFHYYVQDRNYRMVPTGKTKPMEEARALGWQKHWDDHRKSAFIKTRNQITDLKYKAVELPKDKSKPEEKKIEW